MASNRKYAALPDLDSAPDIYETPELTDDNSTVPPTTVRSEDDFDDDDDDDGARISRTHLRVDEARARFMPAAIDATDVDFSDRLNGRRKSYKASTRHRTLKDGTVELGDLSDEDEAESLARRVARLKREIEEAREEYGKLEAASSPGQPKSTVRDEDIASLSKTLDEISRLDDSLAPRSVSLPASQSPAARTSAPDTTGASASYTVTYAPTYEETHALAKAADFDHRLLILEKALGVGSAAMPELDSNGLPRAIIPLLETLYKQISTLSGASTSSLDSISRRVRTLTQEAETLEKSRRNAKAAQEALASTGAAPLGDDGAEEDSEQMAKINAIYGTIPTIESLTPLLPPLLDRLRSLRMIHADAATASETLLRLEEKQAEMAGDIQQWKQGLEKVEAAMKNGDVTIEKNIGVMSEWVKDLEGKMMKMS
ncbi:hypothetical protein B0T18DRAFT_411403 [Schizothecium vesticola]|uniref:Dynactin subunit n=1 Tax=Schizothecium vesticola TaxID=314040 RepID=A0AA40EW14_9PEZI|nr:hypothetical protein B0T18DRAFT_411403 [Schizothecium vesticola]